MNTLGCKSYAAEIVRILDPTGSLFAGRVISRRDDIHDDGSVPRIKRLYGVMGMESAVLIMDDTIEVWPQNQRNLVHVEKYRYFRSRRSNGRSLVEIVCNERAEDGTLAS